MPRPVLGHGPAGGAVLEGRAQLCAAAVDAAAHGAQLDAERGRDLLVGQALDVAQHHSGPEVRSERVQGCLHVAVQGAVVEGLGRRRLAARQPVAGVLGERVEADALLAPDLVEERLVVMRCSQPSNVPGV
jgi:hypothetical protein